MPLPAISAIEALNPTTLNNTGSSGRPASPSRANSRQFTWAPPSAATTPAAQRQRSSVAYESTLATRRQSLVSPRDQRSFPRYTAADAVSRTAGEFDDRRRANEQGSVAELYDMMHPQPWPTSIPGPRRHNSLFPTPTTFLPRRESVRRGDGPPRRGSVAPAERSDRPVQDRGMKGWGASLFSDPSSPSSSPDHTVLTLAQRRRSSLLQSLGIDPPKPFLLSKFLPKMLQRTPSPPNSANRVRKSSATTSLSPSLDPARTAHRFEPSPRLATFRPEDGMPPKSSARRQSLAMGMLDGSESKYTKAAAARKFRTRVAKLMTFVLLVIIFTRGIKRVYLDVETVSSYGMEEIEVSSPDDAVVRSPKSSMWWRKKRPAAASDVSQTFFFREKELYGPPEQDLQTVIISEKRGSRHEETVIFLHGLAQHTWDEPMSDQLGERFPTVRWLMPQAPERVVSVRHSETTPAWFDMQKFPYVNSLDEDPAHLYESARLINSIIAAERSELIRALRERGGLNSLSNHERVRTSQWTDVGDVNDGALGTVAERHWASSRIILAGFSQGGVMALLTGLTSQYRLGGIVVLSGFMPLRSKLASLVADLDRSTMPIFWGHGQSDPYLLHDDALESMELLQATHPADGGLGGLGMSAIEFHSYPGLEHSWFPPEMVHLGNFLARLFQNRDIGAAQDDQ